MSRSRLLQKALALVNRTREEMGMRPLRNFPRGIPESATACPLARALGDWATVIEDRVLAPASKIEPLLRAWKTKAVLDQDSGSLAVALPITLRQFIAAFDSREFPELDDSPQLSTVLKLLNAARRELGLRPLRKIPRGFRKSLFSCPIALSLPGEVHVTSEAVYLSWSQGAAASALARAWGTRAEPYKNYGTWTVELPQELRRFFRAFQDGMIPELDRRNALPGRPGGRGPGENRPGRRHARGPNTQVRPRGRMASRPAACSTFKETKP